MRTRSRPLFPITLLLLLGMLVVFVTACGGSATTTAAPGTTAGGSTDTTAGPPAASGELRIALKGEPDTLDPHATGSRTSYGICRNIFDTLVYRDEVDKSFKPGLAESWTGSPDGMTYTFKLRQDVVFHDGTPFNAEAVVYNMDRIINPETQSKTSAELIGPYESSKAVDEYTVEIKFGSPMSPTSLLDALSQAFLGIVSPTAAEALGPDFGRQPVGTGQYKFKEWRPQTELVLERNADHVWTSPVYKNQGPAKLERVVYKFMPEAATRVAALEGNEIDLVLEVPVESVERLQGNDKFTLVDAVAPGFPVVFWLNVESGPLSDLKVRQAILYNFNRDGLVNGVFRGLYAPAFGPLSPATWSYNSAIESMYPYDKAKAEALLDEAGWTVGPDGIRAKDGQKLTLRCFDMAEPRRGEFFQANMKEIGIDVVARLVTSDELWGVTREANTYEVASTWYASSDPSILNLLFDSKNVGTGFAISRMKSPELDEMLAKGMSTLEDDARAKVYEEIQTYVMENALLVPLYSETEIDAIASKFQDYALERGQYPAIHDLYIAE